jgi:hypothetical protein
MKRLNRTLNPISIIAIFAALSEVSATTVLPHLEGESRQIYIWFLIAFPSALVIMFFLTLNFNNKVLYTPRDKENTLPPAHEYRTAVPLPTDTEQTTDDNVCGPAVRCTQRPEKGKGSP